MSPTRKESSSRATNCGDWQLSRVRCFDKNIRYTSDHELEEGHYERHVLTVLSIVLHFVEGSTFYFIYRTAASDIGGSEPGSLQALHSSSRIMNISRRWFANDRRSRQVVHLVPDICRSLCRQSWTCESTRSQYRYKFFVQRMLSRWPSKQIGFSERKTKRGQILVRTANRNLRIYISHHHSFFRLALQYPPYLAIYSHISWRFLFVPRFCIYSHHLALESQVQVHSPRWLRFGALKASHLVNLSVEPSQQLT